MRNMPSAMSTLRRQARPSASYVDALKARLSVGSSTRVTAALATDSPIRPAKNDRPLTTASPDRADAITESRVETTRGSKTTVYRPDWAFWAPSRRVARWHRLAHGLVGVEVRRGPSHAEAGAGLRVGPDAGDGIDGDEGRGASGRRSDARGRGQRHLRPLVGVVGRRDLADPVGSAARVARSSSRARAILSSIGVAVTPSSHRSCSTADAPSGRASTTSGSGVA